MPSREFAHLPCSDQIDALAVQAAEDFLGQFNGHRSDRDGRRPDGRLCPHALGHGKGAGEQLIELGAHRSNGAGGGVGFLYLSQDLGLAYYHGIEAGGDAKNMTDGVVFAKFVKMAFELR